ncbi:MAG TPA: DUF3619 family protein [Ramlibacter sp.]|nr:DUF3619 family protein [Ramlibacter sp.]
MTNTPITPAQLMQDRFGRRVAARLAFGAGELPYDVTERLRAARVQAVAARKKSAALTVPAVAAAGGTLTFGDEVLGLWGRIGSALPLVALVAGLFLIHTIQNERRASEVAEVDAALLTDDLPPSAYADPGFVQFLKSGRE